MYLVAAGDLVSMAEGVPGYASENPVLVAGVVVGMIVLAGGGVAVYRYLTRSPVSQLQSMLS